MINADIATNVLDSLAFALVTPEVISKESWEKLSVTVARYITNKSKAIGYVLAILILALVFLIAGSFSSVGGESKSKDILLAVSFPVTLGAAISTGLVWLAERIRDDARRHMIARHMAIFGALTFFISRGIAISHAWHPG